jgi:4-diphosphocytidyl-2-C-methyl-D-erythritol kinase
MQTDLPRSLTVVANSKVNLFLRVKAMRSDGFHEIETVYHSLSLADTLTVSACAEGITVDSDREGVPRDPSNLAARAAEAVLARASGGTPPAGAGRGVRIEIAKRIPIGAGLGGGSADAAAVLVAVNRLFDLGLGMADLETAAEGLGADVKFMLHGGCAIGRGRGDELEPARALPPLPVVVVSPGITISTAWAYSSLKIPLTTVKSSLTMVSSALERGDAGSLCGLLENDFESLVFEEFPAVGGIKEKLLGLGARGALMSGSGSSVYGIFSDKGGAKAACEFFSGQGLEAWRARFAVRGVTTT